MNIFYHSTRSERENVTSKQAIISGIAADGGLFVSDQLGAEQIDLYKVISQSYQENAQLIMGTLLGDFSKEELASCVSAAYGSNFSAAEITPLTPLGSDWLLELSHGPTCAFKDIALQMLPQLMLCAQNSSVSAASHGASSYSAESYVTTSHGAVSSAAQSQDAPSIMIVTATSGDTGKAALAGFSGVAGCGVSVFYPEGKVSDIQRLQMVTQKGDNVAVCAIKGNFDDAQTQVKQIFANQALKKRLLAQGIVLSSANSINVGRLVPQVSYYFDAYAQLVRKGALKQGDLVDFYVPTGNFGDVLAGYYAKKLGLPVGKLVVASNANRVLTDFIRSGHYDRRRDFIKTISPSMDILVSSNLERLLYYLSEGDSVRIASYMDALACNGHYHIESDMLERLQESFACGYASDADTKATIKTTWDNEGVLLDPHTAVARCVMNRADDSYNTGNVRICLSTASPYKFSRDVLEALGQQTTELDDFDCMNTLHDISGTAVPPQLAGLAHAPVLHNSVCKRSDMASFVESACERIFA